MTVIQNILQINDLKDFKVHAARYNDADRPLDVFLTDKEEWYNWTAWFNGRHDFNRPYVLSIMDFHHERNAWLFGGIYKILNYNDAPTLSQSKSHAYNIELSDIGADLIGRLKIRLDLSKVRRVRLKAETFIPRMELIEVLREVYTGPGFEGYDKASLTWSNLVSIVKNDRPDWKTALSNMKGVYLISFPSGEHYVGSAYGDVGLWSRWRNYALTRHGGNIEMKKLDKATDGEFIEDAKFTVMEAWPTRTDDKFILERESYWKDVLMTRDSGINKN